MCVLRFSDGAIIGDPPFSSPWPPCLFGDLRVELVLYSPETWPLTRDCGPARAGGPPSPLAPLRDAPAPRPALRLAPKTSYITYFSTSKSMFWRATYYILCVNHNR